MHKNAHNKNRMKKQIFISIFTGLAFALVCAGYVFAEDKPVGKIISIVGMVDFRTATGPESVAQSKSGDVQLVAFTPWEKAKPNQMVYTSDVFRTSRKSRLKILFDDMSLIALGPKSEMKVQSYIYKPEEKLRQGVINVAHGLSMYIINKGQKNKKSSFRIVTPTANIAARGTHGFISVSKILTLVANVSGAVAASNIDPNVISEKLVEAMMKVIIALGQPPTDPEPLTEEELAQIRSVILGWLESRFGEGGGDEGGGFEEFFDLFDDIYTESCTSGAAG